jgi:hypothetical protein
LFRRDFNANFLNQVANDPAVKGGAKLEGITDLSHLVTFDNVLLSYESGCFLLINKGGGTYEVHTLALKEGRGDVLRENIDLAMEYMFLQTDCVRLVTIAYKDNPASIALSERYFDNKGETKEYKYYELQYQSWIIKSHLAKDEGEKFNLSVKTNYAKDSLYDYHVGGAILLIKNGNIGKGAEMYNAWAVMSNYEQIAILSVAPLIMQIDHMTMIYQNKVLEEICQ